MLHALSSNKIGENVINIEELKKLGQLTAPDENTPNDAAITALTLLLKKVEEALAVQATATVAAAQGKKNQRPGKAKQGRTYQLLTHKLEMWGNVPQQQLDISRILIRRMTVGVEYTEQQVFDFMVDGAGEYASIYTSKQDPTYLFRYYRGLNDKNKNAGFIARNFLRQSN